MNNIMQGSTIEVNSKLGQLTYLMMKMITMMAQKKNFNLTTLIHP